MANFLDILLPIVKGLVLLSVTPIRLALALVKVDLLVLRVVAILLNLPYHHLTVLFSHYPLLV